MRHWWDKVRCTVVSISTSTRTVCYRCSWFLAFVNIAVIAYKQEFGRSLNNIIPINFILPNQVIPKQNARMHYYDHEPASAQDFNGTIHMQ